MNYTQKLHSLKLQLVNYTHLKTNNCILLKNFQHTKLCSFQNLGLRFILKIFLKFRKCQPRYSYKINSQKKFKQKRV